LPQVCRGDDAWCPFGRLTPSLCFINSYLPIYSYSRKDSRSRTCPRQKGSSKDYACQGSPGQLSHKSQRNHFCLQRSCFSGVFSHLLGGSPTIKKLIANVGIGAHPAFEYTSNRRSHSICETIIYRCDLPAQYFDYSHATRNPIR
jgi:hypothetical protein